MNISDTAVITAQTVLAKCSAIDPWFAKPSDSVVLAWAEQFQISGIGIDELMDGVTALYQAKGSGFRPLPGDVIGEARAIRHDRAQRSEPAERQMPGDTKAADDGEAVAQVAAGFVAGPAPATDRLEAAKHRLQTCHGRDESRAAIAEFSAAKREAQHC